MTATILARTVHGVEWVCAAEIAGAFPAAEDIRLGRREVAFRLPPATAGPAALAGLAGLRTADDVFIDVGRVDGVGTTRDVPPLLARRLGALPWHRWLTVLREHRPVPARPRLDVVASLDGRRTFNRFAVENTLGPPLARQLNGSYLERTRDGRPAGEADLTARIFINGGTAAAALRLAPRPLHRRPYRQDTGPGALHPPLAAALTRLAGRIGAGVLLDPFCGDGTIPIEASLSDPRLTAIGADLDPLRLANARSNAARAGVTARLVRADAATPPWRERAVAAVVTNPPWNVGVAAGGRLAKAPDRFWRQLPRLLGPGGRLVLIADTGLDLPDTLRRLGYPVGLIQRIRLAGRVSDLIHTAPPDTTPIPLPDDLARWRRAAVTAGVVTDEGL